VDLGAEFFVLFGGGGFAGVYYGVVRLFFVGGFV
jgi:hypothetical protein